MRTFAGFAGVSRSGHVIQGQYLIRGDDCALRISRRGSAKHSARARVRLVPSRRFQRKRQAQNDKGPRRSPYSLERGLNATPSMTW